jgi:hypothetical protein
MQRRAAGVIDNRPRGIGGIAFDLDPSREPHWAHAQNFFPSQYGLIFDVPGAVFSKQSTHNAREALSRPKIKRFPQFNPEIEA